MFQSLVGFKINWNGVSIPSILPCWFQSLVGFKINWNNSELTKYREGISFNP